MSDELDVIAETDRLVLRSDGNVEHGRTRLAQQGRQNWAHEFPVLLADAVRRTTKEQASDYDTVKSAYTELTERIGAVERAIQDTRVDQGEMGLVTESQERNIMRKIDELESWLAAVEEHVSGITSNDSHVARTISDRVSVLEDLVNEAIPDRLEAVEGNVATHEQEIGMTNEDVAMHGQRIKALEARVTENTHNLGRTTSRTYRANQRIDALEASMPAPGPCPGEDMRDQLEARQQVETLEGVKHVLPHPLAGYDAETFRRGYCAGTEEGRERGRGEGRGEMAREIVERLREKPDYKRTDGEVARWIEREYCVEAGR